ncbi:ankyrin repeat domain-containing protein 29 [Biomphalaria pfeifferi]|uniref:Ankyrin repeat domain-containing protein 29 n=1 Tax=Biomphalaria pfeifferi TaxID=112525 RepID=A0AAD8FMF7_BIOPF|nr:ankyrin repeat domain-containing protein 29 [Biomphalaria pfeifferi]
MGNNLIAVQNPLHVLDVKRTTNLMLAAQNGNKSKVIDYITFGVDIDEQNSEGLTALILAEFYGHTSVVKR